MDLPQQYYCLKPGDQKIILVEKGEMGYVPIENVNSMEQEEAKEKVKKLNKERLNLAYSEKIEEKMLSGSMFGWDIPAVKNN